jgi:hypothetical protein
VLGTVLLYLTLQINGRSKRLTDSALSTVAAVCQADSSIQSAATSGRIIMVSWQQNFRQFLLLFSQFFIFLAFSFLYAAYTAKIVSLLQSPSKGIKNLQDLYDSKIELGVDETPYLR